MLKKAAFALLAGSFTFTAAPVTRATDYDWNIFQDMLSFNGSQCSFSDPNATTGADKSSGKLKNVSGSSKWVICPISRTRWLPDIIGATVLTTPGTPATACQLKVRHWTDGTFQTLNFTDQLNIGGNFQTRFMFNPSLTIGGDTSLAIACNLPANESIFTYDFDSDVRYKSGNQ